jgi:hypothetical protein
MEPRFRLLPFEGLISLLKQHEFVDRLDRVLKIRVFSPDETSGVETPELSDECREKYSGTWWEVRWPLPQNSGRPPECFYVADSLRDALRLRPRADLSFWANSSESLTQYLAQTQDWLEEMEEAEMLD